MQLKGKRIVLTGGASGIGAATVLAYAREGAAVVTTDVNDEAGSAVATAAAKLGPGPIIYRHMDVSNKGQVDAVFDEAAQLMGGIDVLAAIAGIDLQKPAEDTTADDMDLQYKVHVKGTAFTNQAAFRYMKDQGGSIINYASYAGVDGMPGMSAYSMAKGAILGWTRSVAKDWGQHKIRLNAVCPGVMTELARTFYAAMSPERRAQIEAWQAVTIPLGGKLGKPEDAASLNVFLASDGSSHMTGGTIAVDGGMTFTR